MRDVFREARERVSAEEAARHYGLTFDRKGWALCPFHGDKHPSMSFKNGRFRCWACGASGSSLDLVGNLLGLDMLGAVRRINEDFRLGLSMDRPPTQAERHEARRRAEIARAHQAFEEWRRGFIIKLNTAYRAAHLLNTTNLDKLTKQEVFALKWQSTFEYWSDTLSYGKPAEQMEIYRERAEIERWIEKALNN